MPAWVIPWITRTSSARAVLAVAYAMLCICICCCHEQQLQPTLNNSFKALFSIHTSNDFGYLLQYTVRRMKKKKQWFHRLLINFEVTEKEKFLTKLHPEPSKALPNGTVYSLCPKKTDVLGFRICPTKIVVLVVGPKTLPQIKVTGLRFHPSATSVVSEGECGFQRGKHGAQ